MAHKNSVYDKYPLSKLNAFKKEYMHNLEAGLDKGHASAAAGLSASLFTVKEWNGKNGIALFDDCLAIASRIELGFLD
jgi:hypothetical protein